MSRSHILDRADELLKCELKPEQRTFVKLCKKLGDIKAAGQQCGMGGDYPYLTFGRICSHYLRRDHRHISDQERERRIKASPVVKPKLKDSLRNMIRQLELTIYSAETEPRVRLRAQSQLTNLLQLQDEQKAKKRERRQHHVAAKTSQAEPSGTTIKVFCVATEEELARLMNGGKVKSKEKVSEISVTQVT